LQTYPSVQAAARHSVLGSVAAALCSSPTGFLLLHHSGLLAWTPLMMQSWRLYTLLLHVMNCMQTWVECHILVQMCSAEEVEHRKEKKRKYNTTPFGINFMRSQALYWAVQGMLSIYV